MGAAGGVAPNAHPTQAGCVAPTLQVGVAGKLTKAIAMDRPSARVVGRWPIETEGCERGEGPPLEAPLFPLSSVA